jgi:hypothetical protein
MHGGQGVKSEISCEGGLRGWCATGTLADKALCSFNFQTLERVRGCFHGSWESGLNNEREIRENERKILETTIMRIIGSCEFTLSPSQTTKSARAAKGYPARPRCAPHPLTLALLWRGAPFNLIEQVITQLEGGRAKRNSDYGFSATRTAFTARSIQHPIRDLGAFAA